MMVEMRMVVVPGMLMVLEMFAMGADVDDPGIRRRRIIHEDKSQQHQSQKLFHMIRITSCLLVFYSILPLAVKKFRSLIQSFNRRERPKTFLVFRTKVAQVSICSRDKRNFCTSLARG